MPGFRALNSCSRARALSACSWLTAQKDQVILPPGCWPSAGERSAAPPAPPAVQAAARAGAPAAARAAARNTVRRVAARTGIISTFLASFLGPGCGRRQGLEAVLAQGRPPGGGEGPAEVAVPGEPQHGVEVALGAFEGAGAVVVDQEQPRSRSRSPEVNAASSRSALATRG